MRPSDSKAPAPEGVEAIRSAPSLFDSRAHLTCYYCELQHDKVEAGGLWYCPNPLCPGPGQASSRMLLRSYRETNSGRYTVNAAEVLAVGVGTLSRCEDDRIVAAIRRLIPRWEQWAKEESRANLEAALDAARQAGSEEGGV